MKAKLFVGGVSTEPDVKRLLETFGCPDEGKVISYADVEAMLGIERTTSRFRTVVTAWRRQLKKLHNVEMFTLSGVGYRVLAPADRVVGSVNEFARGVRKIGRAVTRIESVPVERLDQKQQKSAEHTRRLMHATLSQARSDSKAIAFEFKPQQRLKAVK
jgi:hypothetical protein